MFPVSAVCLNGCEHDNKPVIPTSASLILTENTEEIFRTLFDAHPPAEC